MLYQLSRQSRNNLCSPTENKLPCACVVQVHTFDNDGSSRKRQKLLFLISHRFTDTFPCACAYVTSVNQPLASHQYPSYLFLLSCSINSCDKIILLKLRQPSTIFALLKSIFATFGLMPKYWIKPGLLNLNSLLTWISKIHIQFLVSYFTLTTVSITKLSITTTLKAYFSFAIWLLNQL